MPVQSACHFGARPKESPLRNFSSDRQFGEAERAGTARLRGPLTSQPESGGRRSSQICWRGEDRPKAVGSNAQQQPSSDRPDLCKPLPANVDLTSVYWPESEARQKCFCVPLVDCASPSTAAPDRPLRNFAIRTGHAGNRAPTDPLAPGRTSKISLFKSNFGH